MSDLTVDPQKVIDGMGQQIGRMSVELAMRDAALDAARARIAELEKKKEETPSGT